MTELRKAAEQALDALEEINKLSVGDKAICLPGEIDDAMEALRQALAHPTYEFECPRCGHCCQQREWVGLNHFDRTLLRTTYAPLKPLHYNKDTNTDIVAEAVNDWEAFFTAIEAKLKEKNA